MVDLATNLLASVIAGAAVWLVSRVRARQRTERLRSFFGVRAGTVARIVVARHHASPMDLSVHREDAAAVVELAAMAILCGGRSDLIGFDRAPAALGDVPEVCIGGPGTNPRTAAHLGLLVPGIQMSRDPEAPRTLTIGDRPPIVQDGGEVVHAVIVRAFGTPPAAPVFLVCGETAASNRAAAHHLSAHHRELARRYGPTEPFALLLSLRGLRAYGSDAIVEVDDVTDVAFAPPTSAASAAQGASA